MVEIYNSYSRQKEPFTPADPPRVGMYTCGQTVYDYTHIGHGRKYVNDDLLRRSLNLLGYDVTHVQNITDVGHLTSDADEGEDKLEKGAAKYGKSVEEIVTFFTEHFFNSMDQLNVLRPHHSPKASEHIKEQIKMIEVLFEKGHAYDTEEAVYFSIASFPKYQSLFGQDLREKQVAVREEVKTGTHKKDPSDFVLWFKRVGHYKDHILHWNSPWGDGFPGWHLECSAMSMKYLGTTIDIHTGGVDHLSVHHPNEIAQSECYSGVQFVKYWIHYAFLTVEGQKMSKSLNNFLRVEDITEKGFDPLSLRYLYMNAHYRKGLNFTWESLQAAQNSLNNLRDVVATLQGEETDDHTLNKETEVFYKKFTDALSDDLNMPVALSVVWEVVKSDLSDTDKISLIRQIDAVLGLKLLDTRLGRSNEIPAHITELLTKREDFRNAGEFNKADEVRLQIEAFGYQVIDTKNGSSAKLKRT